jgi:hypothetical protein
MHVKVSHFISKKLIRSLSTKAHSLPVVVGRAEVQRKKVFLLNSKGLNSLRKPLFAHHFVLLEL